MHNKLKIKEWGGSHPKGFALISTVSIMALLVMVVLGMLSLSRSEVQKSVLDRHQLIAQSNARMALSIAIANLQEHTGSDRVVTTRAGIHTADGFTGENVSNSQQHYTLAFSTETLESAWEDARKDAFSRVLASGPQSVVTDLASLSDDLSQSDDAVKLVSSVDPQHEVYARKTEVGGGNQQSTGEIAWYVSGESTKASVELGKVSDDEDQHYIPDSFNVAAVDPSGGLDFVPSRSNPEDAQKVLSVGTLEIFEKGGLDGNEHWITSKSKSLLTNPTLGGFKKDLSAALGASTNLKDAEDALGLRMFANSAGSYEENTFSDPGGPKWSQARSFYQLGESGLAELPVRPQTEEQVGFYPVIAGFTEYYGISNSRGYAPVALSRFSRDYFGSQFCMTMNMSPVIKLWNPYNKPLQSSEYTVAVRNSDLQYQGVDAAKAQNSDQTNITWVDFQQGNHLPIGMRFEHRYHIPSVMFEPGEVKVFTLDKNVFLDSYSRGAYVPAKRNGVVSPMGATVDLIGQKYVLATLKEQAFSGHGFWDMHFTAPNVREYENEDLATFYVNGRGIPGNGSVDGSRTQINDTRTGSRPFEMFPGALKTWNLELYQGRQEKEKGSKVRPLVTIKNINVSPNQATDTKRDSQMNEHVYHEGQPFFVDANVDAIWARSITLSQPLNKGDEDTSFLNPENLKNKKSRWLAAFNPRASTVGCSAYEYTKEVDASGFYVGGEPKVDPEPAGKGHGLGSPGGYLAGLTLNLSSISQVEPQPFIGYSDYTGANNCILFDVPEGGSEKHFVNIGQLRHANLSVRNSDYNRDFSGEDFFSDNMQPAYTIGESIADLRIPIVEDSQQGKHLKVTITDGGGEYTSTHYDTSWFMNQLWDSCFFSTPDPEKGGKESHNSRYASIDPNQELKLTKDGIIENASKLYVEGTLNVNGASVEAWIAFLSSTLGADVNGADSADLSPFTRHINSKNGSIVDSSTSAFDPSNYDGFRGLNEDEIKRLAEEIVEQVKIRAPFFSTADFVNRSTAEKAPTSTELKGAIQAAIDKVELNEHLSDAISPNQAPPLYDSEVYAGNPADGSPGAISQGDILARLGHLLTTRSDTFTIRAYGSSVDENGRIVGQAWCEAKVQRTPEFVDSTDDASSEYSSLSATNKTFGRQYKVISFRWLSPTTLD